jgi:hypothetical protein
VDLLPEIAILILERKPALLVILAAAFGFPPSIMAAELQPTLK